MSEDRRGKKWTDEEIEILKKEYKNVSSYDELATKLNRTRDAVYVMSLKLGISDGRLDDRKNKKTKYHVGDKNDHGWTIVDIEHVKKRTRYLLQCPCGCGEINSVRCDNFEKYHAICKYQKSLIPPKSMPREMYQTRLIGKQFGLLKVLDFHGYKRRCVEYECECQCENKTKVYATYSDLTSGKKTNCGCLTHKKQSESKKKFNQFDLDTYEYGVFWTSNTNRMVLFDKEDYGLIKDYCWSEHIEKGKEDGYINARSIDGSGKIIKLHRLVMNVTDPKLKVDHIKHKLWDNRKSELRVCTNQQNCMNTGLHKNNTSGVPGVNYDVEKNMWRARLYHNNQTIHLGYYVTFEEAVEVRNDAVEKARGEWSYENSMKTTMEA